MTSADGDVRRIAHATHALDLAPRGERWCHLSLCIIDGVFSIGAQYASTWRTARRYAAHANLHPVIAPAREVSDGRYDASEESLTEFVNRTSHLTPEEFAEYLGNRQRTSTRGGVLKAEAVQRFARILLDHDIERFRDVSTLLGDFKRTKRIEAELAKVPGHGSGVRVSYLWMLAGDDTHVKPDRMITRWLTSVLGRNVSTLEATDLLTAAASELQVTPWELDHAVWNFQRKRPSA